MDTEAQVLGQSPEQLGAESCLSLGKHAALRLLTECTTVEISLRMGGWDELLSWGLDEWKVVRRELGGRSYVMMNVKFADGSAVGFLGKYLAKTLDKIRRLLARRENKLLKNY